MKPRRESRHGAEQRKGRGRRAFAEPIEVRAHAGAGDRHAGAEGEPREHQHGPDRADECFRRQPSGGRIGQPSAEHDGVADNADRERREDAKHAAWVAGVEQVAEIAEEAEARALQHEAECRAEDQRQRQALPRTRLRAQRKRRDDETKADRSSARPMRSRSPECTPRRGAFSRTRLGRWGPAGRSERGPGIAGTQQRHLPPQTVPAMLTIGLPTELPYSVHEPS